MSEGYIDSATMHEVIAALMHKRPEECYAWAWQGAIETTCTLIGTEHLKLPPAPGFEGATSGLYADFLQILSSIVSRSRPTGDIEQKARRQAKAWVRRNATGIRSHYEQLKMDKQNFARWLNPNVSDKWTDRWPGFNIEHSRRLDGLMDRTFLSEISSILNKSEPELQRIWTLSCDTTLLEEYAKHQPDDDDFRLMRDAFVVSALVRGVYHDYVAKDSGWQIMHHPLRQAALPRSLKRSAGEYPVSNTQRYFSSIILAGAFKQRTLDARVKCWGENVSKARGPALTGDIDLGLKGNDDVAKDVAIRAAQRLHITTHSKQAIKILDEALNAAWALGGLVLTSFLLSPWEAAGVSAAMYAATRVVTAKEESIGNLLVSATREHRLRDLVDAGPGRVERTWAQ